MGKIFFILIILWVIFCLVMGIKEYNVQNECKNLCNSKNMIYETNYGLNGDILCRCRVLSETEFILGETK
jgi:hypothetical protein